MNGTAYGRSGAGTIWKMTDDLKGVDTAWTDRDGKRLATHWGPGKLYIHKMASGRLFSEDCGTTMYKIDGPAPSVWPAHDLGHLDEAVYQR